MRLLIMGPQGVGKGTQAKLLAEHYGIPTISTGDIFRANIKNKTELGKKVLEYTSQDSYPRRAHQRDRPRSSCAG